MAEIRTEEQREEIAQECARIEKAGGDVLGYLHGLNYISARATWIRLQKEFLGRRKEWQLTDGKPKKKKEAALEVKTETVNDGKGMTVSVITKPVGFDGFTVRAVEGDFGSYRFQEINGKQWIDYDDKELANQLSMTVDQWRGFLEEIRKAAQVLGVEL